MGRDTFENWQSEFPLLLWQVVDLAYFLYLGSPSSKGSDDRTEAKMVRLWSKSGKSLGRHFPEIAATLGEVFRPDEHWQEPHRRSRFPTPKPANGDFPWPSRNTPTRSHC